MTDKLTLVAIQCCSGYSPEQNLAWFESQLAELPASRPMLVALPECFAAFGSEQGSAYQEVEHQGLVQSWLSAQAKRHGIWLLGGSLAIQGPGNKYYAASLLYGPEGERVTRYNKRHLFDVDIADTTGSYRESDFTLPGEAIQIVEVAGFRVGLCVCYDLRFPEHFRTMAERGLDLILVPAAFTALTGAAHWLPLLQARAIENQCYLLAANQAGHHENGRETWGHSMILDPWGQVTGALELQLGMIHHNMTRARLNEVRAAIPALNHRRS